MKREELKALGLDEEAISKVLDMHHAEFDPVSKELEKVKTDFATAQADAAKTAEALKKFEGVEPDKLKQQIEDLKADIKKRDEDHAKEIADRDFNELVGESIRSAKGKNVKAITALLDIDKLKASKNQRADIEAELKALSEAEDSKMLFGENDPKEVRDGDLIGGVRGGNSGDVMEAQLRAAMGLETNTETKK